MRLLTGVQLYTNTTELVLTCIMVVDARLGLVERVRFEFCGNEMGLSRR